jgi:hypothetical protein
MFMKIMLVDDEWALLEIVSYWLRKKGTSCFLLAIQKNASNGFPILKTNVQPSL